MAVNASGLRHFEDVIPTEQLSPISSPATKVSAATAKQEHQYNNN
jgi:hypothetical protein